MLRKGKTSKNVKDNDACAFTRMLSVGDRKTIPVAGVSKS